MSECRVDSPLGASASLLVKSHFVPVVLHPTCTTQSNQHVQTTGAFPLSVRQILSRWQREGVSFHKVIWHFATLCSLALVGNRGNLPQADRRTKLPGIRGSCFFKLCYPIKTFFLIRKANKAPRIMHYMCNSESRPSAH